MLQFPGRLPSGLPMHDADRRDWERVFRQLRAAGFEYFELSSAWISFPDMSEARLKELADSIAESGLKIVATSVVRRSVAHPTRGLENLGYTRRAIEATHALGVDLICLGLHDALRPDQLESEWFWVPKNPAPDPATRPGAIERIRELAEFAADSAVDISLELYEDTFLGTAVGAVDFVTDIGLPNVGLNPDIGNLVRGLGPVEDWERIARLTFPRSNYWHAKNIMRAQTRNGDRVSFPVSLSTGIINYRTVVAIAMEAGYAGPIVVEHYGGDGLGVGAENKAYLAGLFAQYQEWARPDGPPLSPAGVSH
jgi:sugar phosphate isomerase/epimerase